MKNIHHFSAFVIITIIMGLIYVSVQQVYRTSANDPQIQLAHYIKSELAKGKPVDKYFTDTIDLRTSDALFIEITDSSGKPLRSNGTLKGNFPLLPAGVINFVNSKEEDQLTWQPERGVRMAMVISRSPAYPFHIVAVGRSLNETEGRISRLTIVILICWILCITVLLTSWLVEYYLYKKTKMK